MRCISKHQVRTLRCEAGHRDTATGIERADARTAVWAGYVWSAQVYHADGCCVHCASFSLRSSQLMLFDPRWTVITRSTINHIRPCVCAHRNLTSVWGDRKDMSSPVVATNRNPTGIARKSCVNHLGMNKCTAMRTVLWKTKWENHRTFQLSDCGVKDFTNSLLMESNHKPNRLSTRRLKQFPFSKQNRSITNQSTHSSST